MQELELLNADGLENYYSATAVKDMDILDKPNDIFLGCSGCEAMSNAAAITPETIQAGTAVLTTAVGTGAAISQSRKESPRVQLKKELKASCGRKPLFGKAKKDAYNKCKAKFLADRQKSKDASLQAEAAKYSNVPTDNADIEDDTILGMPKGVALGVGLLAVAVIGFVVYKQIKK